MTSAISGVRKSVKSECVCPSPPQAASLPRGGF